MNKPVQGAILDMDGVLTITATIHAKAWRKLFDEFLHSREEQQGIGFTPFSIERDYPQYLDGIPRYDGIKRFLRSRDLDLPFGEEHDAPGFNTICALGNLKNRFFHDQLDKEGVEVFQENIEAIENWKKQGLGLAVISSSKNCKEVLERAGILHLFDVRVDGITSKNLGLNGKPAPDIFLQAVNQLKVAKEKTLVVEDAQLGVEAARKGGFGWIVGFSPQNEQTLRAHGADEVVDSLKSLEVTNVEKPAESALGRNDPGKLPSALDYFEDIVQQFTNKDPVFFFDYDGTLTPIVEDYTEAFLSEKMRKKLRTITQTGLAGVVSGRGLDDVRERVGNIEGFYYVGSHGFEISGPDNFYDQHDEAATQLPILDKAQRELNEVFSGSTYVEVERKKFAIAVHYRNAPEDAIPYIKKKVTEVLEKNALKRGTGKKILELKPDVDWHKGRAIQWLMKELKVDNAGYLPIYIGDDITDEDAFKAIRNKGIGILIGDHGQTTHARYILQSVEEVGLFMDKVIEQLKVKTHG